MEVIESVSQLRQYRARLTKPLALVPTMGALHQGHLRLVQEAQEKAEKVLVTIFLNPLQFNNLADLARYPSNLQVDLNLLRKAGTAAVFVPSKSEIYPDGFQTYVDNAGVSLGLCGAGRPGHFKGVCTVVLKLLNLTQADYVFFGKKDYQQLRVVEALVRDLGIPTKVIGVDCVRDFDGLALSSRNTRLSVEERRAALILPKSLNLALRAYKQGERRSKELLNIVRATISEQSDIHLEYVELCFQDDLTVCPSIVERPAVICLAAMVGETRLIDNLELDER